MCGLFGSRDNAKFIELAKLNAHRGNKSYSIAVFDDDGDCLGLHQSAGEFNPEFVKDGYKVGHVQAPTTEAKDDGSTIHPAHFNGYMLWHNGIIKDFEVKRLQSKYKTDETWDTMLLLEELIEVDWLYNISNINGSFACAMYDNGFLYLFRNEISPLFVDDDMNFSSVKFEGSESLPANTIFMLADGMSRLQPIGEFTTLENPYYFD